jgi:hypothetical protein
MTSSINRPLSPQRRDHARRHRRLQAKGIADGDREFADLQCVRVAKRRRSLHAATEA